MLYDVFLSHNRADKDWTRALFETLSRTDYDGRMLRAWLDERVLDPGSLSSVRELETALDRSHRLALVLTPKALASEWVRHELNYFTRTQGSQRVVVLVRRACELPPVLEGWTRIDWPGEPDAEERMTALLRLLQPRTDSTHRCRRGKDVRRAVRSARYAMGTDFNPGSTNEGQSLLALLLTPDIQNLDEEGLALTGFRAAAQALSELGDADGYNLRLLLSEILAEAQLRSPRYAQVGAEYALSAPSSSFLTIRNRALNGRTGPASAAHLPFTVARAASKLAEIDPTRVDLSTLAALLQNLDDRPALDGPARSVAGMVGRTLGKLRGPPLVDALLYALSEWGGNASHLAVAAAVSCAFDERDAPVYTAAEGRQRAAQAGPAAAVAHPAPRIARLLMELLLPLGLNLDLDREIRNAREDYMRAFGAWDPATVEPWRDLRYAPPLTQLHGGPLVGTLRRVTRADMEAKADFLGPTDIAVLTEPRIVDALFEGAGGFLIDEQQANAPLGTRLRARDVRWATCSAEALERIQDGMAVIWRARKGKPALGYSVLVREVT
jgi:TIR domain